MRLTGKKRKVALVSSSVMRVRRSTSSDCLIAMREKFCVSVLAKN